MKKNSRLAPSIMCIFFNICSFLILALPAWYFSDTTILKSNNNEIIDQSKIFLNLFEYKKLENLNDNYNAWGASLDLTFLNIFNIFIVVALTLSLVLIVMLIIEVIKKSPPEAILPRISKIISIITLILSITALTIALIFASHSKLVILDTASVSHTVSFNLSSGIYLFLIFNIASAACGIISPILKENN